MDFIRICVHSLDEHTVTISGIPQFSEYIGLDDVATNRNRSQVGLVIYSPMISVWNREIAVDQPKKKKRRARQKQT